MRLIKFLLSLFRRKTDWDSLNYGKPAKIEDEMRGLNE